MSPTDLKALLRSLAALPHEVEWVEFKVNRADPEDIGEYISALSNSAALYGKEAGYIVWGIEDRTHEVVGTTFKPRLKKVGNEELENWLATQLTSRINFKIHEFQYENQPVVIFEVPAASHMPVAFKGREFIRVGSYKKSLKEFPEKEKEIWESFSKETFERGIAKKDVTSQQVLSLIDYPKYFELTDQSLPEDRSGILDRLSIEKLIAKQGDDRFHVTNLGAILFAKNLGEFERLARKAIRVIIYNGSNRVETIKEQSGTKGYAVGFEGAVGFINDQLPQNEQVLKGLRQEVRMYPEIAVRELVANAIIHQDFNITGSSPMIEIFSDRIEITNPGKPLIDTLRFIDEPPQSRNEGLAAFMRRMNMCEERGSGIDKVIFEVEFYQLPAPDFTVSSNHTKAILYAHKKLAEMDKKDRIRACYQHACLCYVSNRQMTNATLRKRLSIEDKNYAMASRIISDTIEAGLVKPYDPTNTSKKHAKYVPFWL